MDILAQAIEVETTVAGLIAEGFLFASVKNVGTVAALVGGASLPAGEAKSYPFVGKGYQQVSYNPQGSTLRIMKII